MKMTLEKQCVRGNFQTCVYENICLGEKCYVSPNAALKVKNMVTSKDNKES